MPGPTSIATGPTGTPTRPLVRPSRCLRVAAPCRREQCGAAIWRRAASAPGVPPLHFSPACTSAPAPNPGPGQYRAPHAGGHRLRGSCLVRMVTMREEAGSDPLLAPAGTDPRQRAQKQMGAGGRSQPHEAHEAQAAKSAALLDRASLPSPLHQADAPASSGRADLGSPDAGPRGEAEGCARVETMARASEPLMGQDKWLGGMCSPCGRYVYGVPGTAKEVLQLEVATGEVRTIGGPFPGKFKWLRGVEVPAEVMGEEAFPCGACFALPSNSNAVLRIDPATQEVATIGGPFTGDWLWHGGNLAADGCIYGIPGNAEHVLKIDPRTSEVSQIGGPFKGRQKWYGGVLASNGSIYGIPQTSTGVLKITPSTGECIILGDGTLPEGGWKWHGGLATDDQHIIYGFPNNASHVLKVDTRTDEISLIGGPDVLKSGRHRANKASGVQDNKYKYLGGAIASDGNCYVFPCDAEKVLCINTKTDEVRCVGPELLEGENKWQNGFRARDGAVYAIPQRSASVLRVLPGASEGAEPQVELLHCGEEHEALKDKFEGGVMGADGCIYCIPLRAKRVLKIIPGPKPAE